MFNCAGLQAPLDLELQGAAEHSLLDGRHQTLECTCIEMRFGHVSFVIVYRTSMTTKGGLFQGVKGVKAARRQSGRPAITSSMIG
jgi:hypothetical protein